MTVQDDSNAAPHVYVLDEPTGREPTLEELLSPLVRLSDGKLRRLATTIAGNVSRELREGGGRANDAAVRRIVVHKHVQSLRDAIDCSGPFVLAAKPAALLAIRYLDRPAFEAYARLHARLVATDSPGLVEIRKLREMLLGLRLRMLCLDWATISLVAEGLGGPCDEAALRKRQSRITTLAASDASSIEDWLLIDRYLKAKRRSFGGTRRLIPIGPALIVLVLIVAMSALAYLSWHALAGHPTKSQSPGSSDAPENTRPLRSPGASDQPQSEPSGARPDEKSEARRATERQAEPGADDSAVSSPSLSLPQDGWSDQPWVVLYRGAGISVSSQSTKDSRKRRVVAAVEIRAPVSAVDTVLLDFQSYASMLPHVVSAAPVTGRSGAFWNKTARIEWSWPGVGPVDEFLRYTWSHHPGGEQYLFDALVDPTPSGKPQLVHDRTVWTLTGKTETRLDYDRTIDLTDLRPPLETSAILDAISNDVRGTLEAIEHAAVLRDARRTQPEAPKLAAALPLASRLPVMLRTDELLGALNRGSAAVDRYLDLEKIVEALIAPRLDSFSVADRTAFTRKFGQLMMALVHEAPSFLVAANVVKQPQASADAMLVPIHIVRAVDDTDIVVGLVWKDDGGVLKIVDVLLDGDSLIVDYRNRIISIIDKKGVRGLFENVDERLASAEKARRELVRVVLHGGDSQDTVREFMDLLKQRVRELRNVTTVAYKSGEALLDVRVNGDTRSLAAEIDGASMDRYIVHVRTQEGNSVEVELTRTPP